MHIQSSQANGQFACSRADLAALAQAALSHAAALGASACDVDVSEGYGQSVTVRLGSVETIEYNRDKGIGVTVYFGQQKGHASTSDFSPKALRDTVAAAASIARYTAADDCAGLADAALLARSQPDLDLYHPWALPVEQAIDLAHRCEAAARGADARISNSEGATVSTQSGHFIYANSNGFCDGYASSRHSISCSVIAESAGGMQRDYWYSVARQADDLLSAEAVGQMAGERTARRLGARRIATCQVPVLFDASLAAGLIGHFISAISGGALYRKSSFLLDSLGQQVFSPLVQISERPHLARGLASSAFDAEGVATRDRELVSQGVVNGYLLGSYSARKLGLQSTGNAGGSHNLLVASTGEDVTALLQKMGSGLLVTELLGHGVNQVTGDYSRGAAGFWVENGVLAFPVEEITIAGNLREMFRGVVAIGNDILIRGSKQCGSILIDRMTIAGE